MQQKPNYQDRKKKTISSIRQKQQILAVLLAASLSFHVVNGLNNLGETIVNKYQYDKDARMYDKLMKNNIHRTDNLEYYFIDTYELAQDIKEIDIKNKEEFYHVLCKISQEIDYNRTKNFKDLINCLRLDELASTNPNYPTEQEFMDFLGHYGLFKDDGSIDFDAWRKYDKKVFSFENELERNAKESKGK